MGKKRRPSGKTGKAIRRLAFGAPARNTTNVPFGQSGRKVRRNAPVAISRKGFTTSGVFGRTDRKKFLIGDGPTYYSSRQWRGKYSSAPQAVGPTAATRRMQYASLNARELASAIFPTRRGADNNARVRQQNLARELAESPVLIRLLNRNHGNLRGPQQERIELLENIAEKVGANKMSPVTAEAVTQYGVGAEFMRGLAAGAAGNLGQQAGVVLSDGVINLLQSFMNT